MKYNTKCKKIICFTIMWLMIIQGLFLLTRKIAFSYMNETLYSRSMMTMITMIIILIIMILYCQYSKQTMSVFPARSSVSYIAITVIAVIFYTITLFVVKDFSVPNILMLLYGSFVTPVFEELLFRGFIWNKLNSCFRKEMKTYLVVTLLFVVWHIGYAIGIYFWLSGNLLIGITMKVVIGLIFGVITGAIRYKTKNCYLGIVIHGILNVFG